MASIYSLELLDFAFGGDPGKFQCRNKKFQYWRAFPGIYAPGTAPVLEFRRGNFYQPIIMSPRI